MSNYFLNRYSEMTGDEQEDIYTVPKNNVLRLNTLVTNAKQLTERLIQKSVKLTTVDHIPHAYHYKAKFSLGSTPEYLMGMYYLQEPASQLPVLAAQNVLESLQDLDVLDMCAAPGSKTTQLAAAMNNTGKIVALEVDRNRSEALANNCERCRVENTTVYHKDALYAHDLNQKFDVVFLDAPCSGNFCSEKNWLNKRKPTDAKQTARLQKELLQEALRVLKPKGILVYSTCSLELEENEEVLQTLPQGYKIVDTGLEVGSPGLTDYHGQTFRKDMNNAVRIWPHKDRMQGFFVAVIKKSR